jgi:hypothetical protein
VRASTIEVPYGTSHRRVGCAWDVRCAVPRSIGAEGTDRDMDGQGGRAHGIILQAKSVGHFFP